MVVILFSFRNAQTLKSFSKLFLKNNNFNIWLLFPKMKIHEVFIHWKMYMFRDIEHLKFKMALGSRNKNYKEKNIKMIMALIH